ncbi:MAG: hypothetical protein ACO22L_07240 [Candidatus Nanopelagicaceae bacterium]
MATRARIALELKDGSVLSVYHHWDGYPEWLGRILKTHYNAKSLVEELIDGGDMSSCWTEDRFSIDPTHGWKVQEYGPQYYSQRGEDRPPRLDKNLSEYLQNSEEYSYVYTQEEGWLCYDTCSWRDSYMEGQEIPSGALAV